MKKTKKMLGAVVLSACLAMGTVPAFAGEAGGDTTLFSDLMTEGGSPEVGDTEYFKQSADGESASGTTNVDVYYRSKVISAQVPLRIAIVATGTSSSAGRILAPDASTYQITNTGVAGDEGSADVFVSKVESKDTASSDWTLDSAYSGTDKGILNLTLRGGAGETLNLGNNYEKPNPTDWDIARGESLNLKLDGTSKASGALYTKATGTPPTNDDDGTYNRLLLNTDAFKIIYTLSMVDET